MLFAPSVTNSYGGAVFPGIQDCVVYAKDSGREEDWNEVRGAGGDYTQPNVKAGAFCGLRGAGRKMRSGSRLGV